jgi:hypothetical protein
MMLLAIMAAMTFAQAGDDEAWLKLKARIERAPQPIATFIERRTGCNHWDGEAGSDEPAREEQVQRARKDLRCNHLEADELELRTKYRMQADVLKLLDDTKDLMPW